MIEGFLYSAVGGGLSAAFKVESKGKLVAHFGSQSPNETLYSYYLRPGSCYFHPSEKEYPIAPKVILKWTDQ